MKMRATQGYITNDGTFYERDVDAQLHEQEMILRAYCVSHKTDPEKLLTIIEALADPIMEYVHAFQAKAAQDARTPPSIQDQEDYQSGEDAASTILK